jgi:hypothetical protein
MRRCPASGESASIYVDTVLRVKSVGRADPIGGEVILLDHFGDEGCRLEGQSPIPDGKGVSNFEHLRIDIGKEASVFRIDNSEIAGSEEDDAEFFLSRLFLCGLRNVKRRAYRDDFACADYDNPDARAIGKVPMVGKRRQLSHAHLEVEQELLRLFEVTVRLDGIAIEAK